MKIRFEKVEIEVTPQFLEHVARVYAELEMMQARLRSERIQTENVNRTNLLATFASVALNLLRQALEVAKSDNDDDDGDGGDDAPGTEGGGASQPA